ncbi:MAG: FAD:protein FMN transferase [Candidatus Eisenbacteria bacterium]|nr:FAD:protein FMN transferase [Candidatus Eisenbacteria bacterium]
MTLNRRLILEILAFVVVVLLIVVFMARRAGGPGRYDDHRLMMGTVVGVTVFAPGEDEANEAMQAAFDEVRRVEELASRYIETSQVARWNARSEEIGEIDPEIAAVVARALVVAELSGGAFDPTIAPVVDLWDFEAGSRVPDEDEVRAALADVDYAFVDVRANEGVVAAPIDTDLDLDGIIKGYAVDRAVEVLREAGIEAAIVDAGGDVGFLGRSPNGPAWRVGVKHPRRDGLIGVLAVDGGSVATSGDYQRYVDVDGVRYHHLIDPATGYPARDLASVTVWARSALDADALATAVFVMGPDDGLALAERLEHVEALIVTPDGEIDGTPRAMELFTRAEEGNGE